MLTRGKYCNRNTLLSLLPVGIVNITYFCAYKVIKRLSFRIHTPAGILYPDSTMSLSIILIDPPEVGVNLKPDT